jgi:opacity protein-like surface antigen
MKKLVLIVVFLLGFSMMATAQDTPLIEVFGGYSFAHIDTATAFAVPETDRFHLSMNGWDASIAINANKWAGFVVDFGGLYGSPWEVEIDDVSIHAHSIMIGPRISVRQGKITPFFQALIGYAHVTAEELTVNVYSANNLAIALGGGVDINVNDRIAIRPAQLEYFTIRSGESTGNFSDNLRYSAGIVFKLGKR